MNRRDRSKITAEIQTVEPLVLESMQGFWGGTDETVYHFYHKGYLDALRWVIANTAIAKAKGGA